MSGTVYEGFYYVGVSSSQESTFCCSFRGSFQKIDLRTGRVVWRTFMLPADSGYYGVAVWGSSPSTDERRRLVYIATGNNYRVPESVEECELQQANKSIRDFPDPCIIPANHEDSILALSIDDGSIVWSKQLGGYDVSLVGCVSPSNPPKCPQVLGPDYDFGEAPMLLEVNGSRCIVVTGQKSGMVWALECDTGEIVWSTAAGPGGLLGGASWGAATDTKRVYTSIGNYFNATFVLAPSTNVTKGGGWVGMDARTGEVLWSTANPSGKAALGPVSMVNGLLFGGSFASTGELYAMDALTGTILWQYTTGAIIYGEFSIAYGCVYGGNGYTNVFGDRGTSFYAFCVK